MGLEVVDWADQTSWDGFVGSQASGHYNQSWAWGEIAGLFGGKVIRRAVVDGERIVAAMSVGVNPIRRSPWAAFHISRGPAVDNPTPDVMRLLLADLESLARTENAVVAKLEPYVAADDNCWPALLRAGGFAPLHPGTGPRSVWCIDLRPELDEILAGMKSKWRYNVRLAEKRGVVIRAGSAADVDEYYRLYQETSARDDFYIHTKEMYRRIFDAFWERGQFDLLLAELDGKPIAAVTLITVGKTCWYAYGASSGRDREVMAPHALQWEAIKVAKARGALLYDLRGVPDVPGPGQDMSGVYRFKQGFGGYHLTLMEQYARGYRQPWFALWKAYWQGRFFYITLQRRRKGLPHRQWA